MLGALSSLTGGGGLSSSSSATNGDQSGGVYSVGNMTFGAPTQAGTQNMVVGVFLVIGLYVAYKKLK